MRFAILPLALALGGCGVENFAVEDPADDEAELQPYALKSIYAIGRQDMRKCAFPACGGVWLQRTNLSPTTCADGSKAQECYAAEVDLSKLALGSSLLEDAARSGFAAGTVVLRGKLAVATYSGRTSSKFVATEAWMAGAPGEPGKGVTFYKGTNSGVRCMRAPCPSVRLEKLNSTVRKTADSIDFDAVPGDQANRDDAVQEMMTTALVVAGSIKKGTPVEGDVLVATQVYRRVQAAGQVCGDGQSPPCGVGAACCYPCGVPGCQSVCMVVDETGCPLRP